MILSHVSDSYGDGVDDKNDKNSGSDYHVNWHSCCSESLLWFDIIGVDDKVEINWHSLTIHNSEAKAAAEKAQASKHIAFDSSYFTFWLDWPFLAYYVLAT